MRRFRLSPLARSDLAEIRHFIRKDKPAAADRQIATFFRSFHVLAKNREMGQHRPEFGSEIRTFSVGNYVVVYRPFAEGVEVVRVVSGFRDLDNLLGAP
jgi:toxin ParE1/3/4